VTPDEERRAAAVPGVPVADRLRALADAPWSERGDAATQAALREGADAVERLAAVARGAQYREREARNEVAMLRGALDDAKRAGEVQRACALLQGTIAAIALDRWRRADDARAQADAGDLAGLARREAGPVTRRQWRACARCGREHWLADGEAAPLHGWVDPWGAAKTCAAVTVGEGSEGR